ncbi:MAG: gliding motility-associated C-terminal domain-containing protein, partial [Phaeodactylibacter sp.]|nr:gliding motility-associated C-terminal domain-containing protein [Phaeodactylibacter sp.]
MTTTTIDPNCYGEEDGSIILEDVTGGTAPYRYNLDGGTDFPVFQIPLEILNLGAGTYGLTFTDAEGCTVTDNGINLYNPLQLAIELGPDTTIHLGEYVELEALLFPGALDPDIVWTWSPVVEEWTLECDTCVSIFVAPTTTTNFYATYTDASGCTVSDTVQVIVDARPDIFIPNAFSPDGDGVNDKFYIYAREGLVDNVERFLVFSRWGEVVCEYYNFYPNNPASGWDGYFKGKPMNPAVFAYFAVIRLKDGRTVLYEGDVLLLR